VGVIPAAVLAALLPALFPFASGYQARDTPAVVLAAALAACMATALMPLTFESARPRSVGSSSTRDGLAILGVAILSAGAAAIHLAVAKMHFEEYTPFGLFFVASGVAQLVWGLWLMSCPSPGLLVGGAVGNALIVVLWIVSRTAGLPVGPEHWKPEAIGFADVAASGFEALLAIGCFVLLVGKDRQRLPRLAVARPAMIGMVVVVAVVTTLGLLSAIGVASSLIAPSA
jgi:hypothetical protein